MKVKRKYCKPEFFVLLDEVELSLLAGSYDQPIVSGGGAGTGNQDDNAFGSRIANPTDSTFVDDDEDIEPEIWTGYKKYNGFK